ncbi:MAG: MFS transporter [Candidatus Hodarchaeota archaeon]
MALDDKKISREFTFAQHKRNVKIFQILGFDITVLVVPVIVLVWLDAGLSFSEILLLQGLFVVPTLILEVPSGSFADYWSRKGCTAVYHMLFGVAMLIYAVGNNFYLFAIAEVTAGIGVAFQTGSETALIYDSLIVFEKDSKGKFGRTISKRMTVMFIGGAFGALAGGIIGTLSLIRIPIILTFFGHIFSVILVYFGYTEPPRLKAKTPKAAIKKTLKSLTNSELSAILVFSLTGLVFSRIGFWAVQHMLVGDYYINALGMAFVLAGFNICAAVSSLAIRTRVNQFSNFFTFLAIIIVEGFYFWSLIKVPNLIAILFVSLIAQLTRGIRTPLIQAFLQEHISSDTRATFVSLMSFTGSLLYFIFSLISDVFDLSRDVSLSLGLLGLIVIASVFIGFLVRKFRSTSSVSVPRCSKN